MIYHVTKKVDWEKAQPMGFYETESLSREGFIHLSRKEQLAGMLERYYKNITGLVLLHINETKLTAPLKYEISASINESFPHLYGRLNLNAVEKVTAM